MMLRGQVQSNRNDVEIWQHEVTVLLVSFAVDDS